jgi:hypothetical protein
MRKRKGCSEERRRADRGMELPEPFALVGMVIFSSFGVWALKEGRREANIKQLLLGIVLLVYSYMTSDPWLVWGIGIALMVAVFKVRD